MARKGFRRNRVNGSKPSRTMRSAPSPIARARRVTRPPGPIIHLRVKVPRSVLSRVRRKIYSYPSPKQIRLNRRVIRVALTKPRKRMDFATVKIRLPSRLPRVFGSYVSLRRNRLNIHSRLQHRRLMERLEANRTRYSEGKSNRRKARNGQLDSRGALSGGLVAQAYHGGFSAASIADHALAARAIFGG